MENDDEAAIAEVAAEVDIFNPEVLLCNKLLVDDLVREFSRLNTSLDGFLANSETIFRC